MGNRRWNALAWIDHELGHLADQHLLRRRVTCQVISASEVEVDGQRLIDFASNDYLGLAGDPRVVAAGRAESRQWGSAASPLISGRRVPHEELEAALARFEGTEAAILFPSGYAANLGTIAALVGPGDCIYSDQFNHASIIDGCRLSRADLRVYPHADMAALERMFGDAQEYRRRLIVSDALFSMDGDLAPVDKLVDLAARNNAMLMLDEAHATGVFGVGGRGAAEQFGADHDVPIRVGTLSKALGSAGGFVCGSRALIELLVNRSRPYVYSTAAPAAASAAALAALRIVEGEPQRRTKLLERAHSLRVTLTAQGWDVGATRSQIVPLVVGDEAVAMRLSASLRQTGLWVPAIRPPSVGPGTSRLRISLNYAHTAEMLERLVTSLAELAPASTISRDS